MIFIDIYISIGVYMVINPSIYFDWRIKFTQYVFTIS